MSGSTWGTLFRVTTWGESHGPAIGAVVDGCPAGLPLSEDDLQRYLDRRRPGQDAYTTSRREPDRVEILSGLHEGVTTGTPLSLLIRNQDARPEDYETLRDIDRPGHADHTYAQKYGQHDPYLVGRASGRETAARVAAGAVACKLLEELGISLFAYAESIGGITVETVREEERDHNPLGMPDAAAAEKALAAVHACMQEGDSLGGTIGCIVRGLPAGLGEPVFDKLDAVLAKALLSIGGVKGVEVGDGFRAALSRGSENNDAYLPEDGPQRKRTNHAGGILGGISDGDEVFLRIAVKPTPSIVRAQETCDHNGQPRTLEIRGRHDPVLIPRMLVVVESMVALTLADALLCGMGSRLDDVRARWC